MPPTPKRPLLALVAFAATTVFLAPELSAHGGAFRGAGDTVPSTGAGAGAAGNQPRARPGPGSSRPGSSSGPSSTFQPGRVSSTPKTPLAVPRVDLNVWEFYWGFNKEPLLEVKSAIHQGKLIAGSDNYFLGHVDPDQAQNRLRPSAEQIRRDIVPALLRALAREHDNDTVTGVIVALAKIGDGPKLAADATSMADRFLPFLKHANQEISETAAVALGILGSEPSVPILSALLADDDTGRALIARASGVPWRTRAFAAYGLGLIGSRTEDTGLRGRIARTLARHLLAEADAATPDVAVACITSLGLAALPNTDGAASSASAGSLETLEQQIRFLLGFARQLDDSRTTHNPLVRAHLPTAIARLTHRLQPDSTLRAEVREFLLSAVAPHGTLEREVRASSLLALGEVGSLDRTVRKRLLELVRRSPQPLERNYSVVALAKLGARTGDGDEDRRVREEIRQALRDALEHGGAPLRPWVGMALGLFGRALRADGIALSADVDEELRRQLERSTAPESVGALSIAIGLRGDLEAKPLLLEKLDQVRDDGARGYVALGLGLLGETDAIWAIQSVVKRSKYRPELMRQAAISLGLLGDKRVTPDLVKMLRDATSLSSQAAIASALGHIGDARSIPSLIVMLGNQEITPRARAFAAVALGIVADKEPLPWNTRISEGINYRANTTTLTDESGAGILDIL